MTEVILRLTLSSNSVGPFNVYVDSIENTPIYTNATRDQLIAGLVISLQGSLSGITYKIIVENLQIGCENDTIIKEITVFDTTPDPTSTPTPTPTTSLSQTPTSTPTSTVTPTKSLTPTPTKSPGASNTPTPTPTTTSTTTPTPSITPSSTPPPVGKALLLIEPISTGPEVNQALQDLGVTYPDFLGFSSPYMVKTLDSLEKYMLLYSNNIVDGLMWYELNIPLTGDRQYLFDEIRIPAGTVNEYAWYTFVIPDEYIGGGINRLTQIEFSRNGTYSSEEGEVTLESTLYNFGSVYYNGIEFENKNYRFYSTWANQALRLNNTSTDLYFRGKKIN